MKWGFHRGLVVSRSNWVPAAAGEVACDGPASHTGGVMAQEIAQQTLPYKWLSVELMPGDT